ncbi:hypothetical protein [Chitinilyticum aquatile]|uniref:hypothetical protein n=1 Tax=Chitinilyticum aquatile TaxID=362520 RepID=UPI0012DCB0D3|nr:hypothetical protein [Chitinilyticum aquatile]
MQPGLYLAFDPPVTTPGPRAGSQLIAALAMLEDIAQEWGVKPLSQYLDQGGQAKNELRHDWHAISDGLMTIGTLAGNPACEDAALQTELFLWVRQLEFAQSRGVSAFRIEVGLCEDETREYDANGD